MATDGSPTAPATPGELQGATGPDERRWMEFAQRIQNRSAQVQAMAGTGGTESEWVGGVEQTTPQIQSVVYGLTRRQGAGVNIADLAINLFVGKNVISEGVTNNTSFKQWGALLQVRGRGQGRLVENPRGVCRGAGTNGANPRSRGVRHIRR